MLLPFSPEPFVVQSDRDMLSSERRLFVRTHRTCVLGYGRLHDGPAMSVVSYVPTDEDDSWPSSRGSKVSTTSATAASERRPVSVSTHHTYLFINDVLAGPCEQYASSAIRRRRHPLGIGRAGSDNRAGRSARTETERHHPRFRSVPVPVTDR